MKKYLFPLFFAVLSFSACSGNEPEEDPNPEPPVGPGHEENPYITGIDLSMPFHVEWDAEADETYSFLGYGYDMTGKFAHPASVRELIFDMELFDREYEGSVVWLCYPSSKADYYFGGDATQCLLNMAGNAKFDKDNYSRYKNLFKEAILPSFENDDAFPELKYDYFGYSALATSHIYRFYWNTSRDHTRYLTDRFRADLDKLSSEEIFRKYGTHLITGALTGSRIDFVYRSTSTDISAIQEWGTYCSGYYLALGYAPSEPRSARGLKDNLYFEFLDGSRHDPNAYMIDLLNYEGGIIRLEGMADAKEEDVTLIGFSNTPVPLYELVSDPAKREGLRDAFEEYLGAR